MNQKNVIIEACYVCNGYGTVNKPPWIAGDQESWADNRSGPYPCPVCRGSGLVVVNLNNHKLDQVGN